MSQHSETDIYQTIEDSSIGEYKEKGSKFFAYAKSIKNLEEGKGFLEEVRQLHPKARHHCYAYRIGRDKGKNYRANDDGEPSGTAGKPIIGQIDSKGLTNIIIIVVRYFGGTKLGVPGLIRSYKTATIDALENATIVTKKVMFFYQVDYDYLEMNRVMKLLKKEQISILEQNFDLKCQLKIKVRESAADQLLEDLQKIDTLKTTHLYTA